MTTSTYNASADALTLADSASIASVKFVSETRRRHTLASSLIFVMICVAIVLSTIAYGTVHYWALAVFALGAAGILCLWAIDGAILRSIQVGVNPLQWPLIGIIILALIQLLPLRPTDNAGLALSPIKTL